MKTAIITGITGQDGSYLAELLLNKDYQVIGGHRRSSVNNFERVKDLIKNPRMIFEEFDITDPSCCSELINKYRPDEVYNLAAQSHVGTSFKQPSTTFEIDTIGVINLLEAIRSISKDTKFYQASTSEMFGRNYTINSSNEKFQDENTELLPQSPYGVAKMASHRMVQIYREAYGLYACSGILFNHESPRRGENFVTRKITKYIGSLVNGQTKESLKLGNLNASRDWGHAKDYVYAMYLMLQADIPDDFVICTGSTYSVLDFLKTAFQIVNLNYKDHVEIDQDLLRPAEVSYLKGKNSKAKTNLGWEPTISFDDLVKEMVLHDIEQENNIGTSTKAFLDS
jgi:GDPmannose 4,6-dehydratase